MSLILRQIIGYQQGRRAVSTTANPLLKKQLEDTQKDLNSILTEWNWGGRHPQTTTEFLNKFKPWVNEKIKLGKEVEALLAKKGVNNLSEL